MVEGKAAEVEKQRIERRILFFPLFLKVELVLLFALIPAALLMLVVGGVLPIPAFPLWIIHGSLRIGSFQLPVLFVIMLATLALSLGLGLAAAETLFIHRTRRLLLWLLDLRRENFRSVPPLPRVGRDELGEINRQMAFAALTFSRMKEETEGAFENRSLFLMTAAHQLRTPLTALVWTIQALRNPATPEDERAQLLASMDTSLSRMQLVVEHILASASVEEGKFGYVFEPIDIVPILEKLVDEFKPLSEKHQVAIVLQHEETFPVFADKERITLAVADLISNAVQYTPKGGTVTVSARGAGDRVEVAVADTGIGITEKERALLFSKFYRGDRARHMRPDGTGLGLYLVHNIIEKHGSDIAIDSKEGQGTRFSFFLHSKREALN